MTVTRVGQDHIKTLGSSIDDTKTPTDHDGNAVDLQDTLDYLCSQVADILGEVAWETAPDLSIASMAAKTWLEDKKAPRDKLVLQDITVTAAQNWEVLSASGSETPSRPIAISASTSGAVVAELAGDVGAHALTELAGDNALNPQNLVFVVDATTGDPIKSDDRQVYGLFQVENGATDGGSFDDTDNQAQISFVRPNATYDDLEACPVADIAGKSILYSYADREALASWSASDFRRGAVLVDLGVASVSQTLDIAYNGGSVVDVDDTNVDWRLTDTKHFIVSDDDGSPAILDVHAEAAGDEVEFTAPGGITINSGDISAASNKATFNGTEIGGAAGRVATLSGDLDLRGADDITFVTTRESTPLPLDDATAGAISALTGGPFASISAAIKYAIEHGIDFSLGSSVLGSNYAQDANIPAAAGIDISSPHSIDMNTLSGVDTIIFINGVAQYGGNGTTTNSIRAGDTPANGDIKVSYPKGLKTGDWIFALQLSA